MKDVLLVFVGIIVVASGFLIAKQLFKNRVKHNVSTMCKKMESERFCLESQLSKITDSNSDQYKIISTRINEIDKQVNKFFC